MKLFPESAVSQLEFDRIVDRLAEHCQGELAKDLARRIRIHTQLDHIRRNLRQTQEFKWLLDQGLAFPNEEPLAISRELRLLGIPGSVLMGSDWIQIRRLLTDVESVFRWFTAERREAYSALAYALSDAAYEKRSPSALMRCWKPMGRFVTMPLLVCKRSGFKCIESGRSCVGCLSAS